jgi:hypothetical protein
VRLPAVLLSDHLHVLVGAAASPCPPPPPPVFDAPDCPTPANVVTGSMVNCYGNDCTNWGIRKAYDGKTRGWATMAHTGWSYFPWMQLDLGTTPPNVTAVRIVARDDSIYAWESQNIDVFVSATTNWTASTATLCATNISFTRAGETTIVLCPTGFTWASRYVTVVMNSTANRYFNGYLSLNEITPLYDGKIAACFQCRLASSWASAVWVCGHQGRG